MLYLVNRIFKENMKSPRSRSHERKRVGSEDPGRDSDCLCRPESLSWAEGEGISLLEDTMKTLMAVFFSIAGVALAQESDPTADLLKPADPGLTNLLQEITGPSHDIQILDCSRFRYTVGGTSWDATVQGQLYGIDLKTFIPKQRLYPLQAILSDIPTPKSLSPGSTTNGDATVPEPPSPDSKTNGESAVDVKISM